VSSHGRQPAASLSRAASRYIYTQYTGLHVHHRTTCSTLDCIAPRGTQTHWKTAMYTCCVPHMRQHTLRWSEMTDHHACNCVYSCAGPKGFTPLYGMDYRQRQYSLSTPLYHLGPPALLCLQAVRTMALLCLQTVGTAALLCLGSRHYGLTLPSGSRHYGPGPHHTMAVRCSTQPSHTLIRTHSLT
jgi:hypothetical protein